MQPEVAKFLEDVRQACTLLQDFTRALERVNFSVRKGQGNLAGVVPAIADFPAGCRFNPRCAQATEICRTTEPATTLLGAGGLVRCHHHA